MYYQSTRSEHRVSDTAAILEGIAPNGGLYIDPELAGLPAPAAAGHGREDPGPSAARL